MQNATEHATVSVYAALGAVSEAGEQAFRLRRGITDAAGDVVVLLSVFGSLATLLLTLVGKHLSIWVGVGAAAAVLVVGSITGAGLWLIAERPVSAERILREGIRRCGGIGALPAVLPTHFERTVFTDECDRYLARASLSAAEKETFDLLRSEGFEGTLAELVHTSQMLNM